MPPFPTQSSPIFQSLKSLPQILEIELIHFHLTHSTPYSNLQFSIQELERKNIIELIYAKVWVIIL